MRAFKHLVAFGLFCAVATSSHASLLPQNYVALTDGVSGAIYLRADQIFVLLHATVDIPLKLYPRNGIIKLEQGKDGKWTVTALTADQIRNLNLTAAAGLVEQIRELNGAGGIRSADPPARHHHGQIATPHPQLV